MVAITRIPAGWKLPADLAEAVAERDAAEQAYKQARNDLSKARQAVRAADADDTRNILAGKTSKSVRPDREAAEQAATIKRRQAERARNTAEGRVKELLTAHFPDLARQTAQLAREGTEAYRATRERLRAEHDQAVKEWRETHSGFRTLMDQAHAAGWMFQNPPQPKASLDDKAVLTSHLDHFADMFERLAGIQDARATRQLGQEVDG